jgi:hypothetical protein
MFRVFQSRIGSRPVIAGAVVLAGVLSAVAQATPEGQAPQAVSSQRLFPDDGGLVLNYIKPDKAADFEIVMAKLKEALRKSNRPERKEQAAGWRVFKSADPAGTNALYIYVISPSSKIADYQVPNIIAEGFPPAEANDILKSMLTRTRRG